MWLRRLKVRPHLFTQVLFKLFIRINPFFSNVEINANFILKNLENLNTLLVSFFIVNENLWQEGLYTDFLQKKLLDNWTRKFLIISTYLFNEKKIFDLVTRFFLIQILIPVKQVTIFEVNSLANLLFITVFIFLIFYTIIFYAYIGALLNVF